ncbi:MAG: leucine--tRNA ligase [Candidatus Paceibacterota bacterium]
MQTRGEYDHKKIERSWQEKWKEQELYKTHESDEKEKCFVLDMFPYPSGEGLHVGHPKGYIATDIYSRFQRMNGKAVLHPMGWDAFGLPAENYAIKNKVHPKVSVDKNIARYKEQLSIIGPDYDWSREINTTDPGYYKWTQWIFLQLFKKGLAYESNEPINWCPSCQTGLANEDLEDGKCERCGSVIVKKPMRQWVLKITDYADRLLNDLETLDWPESIKVSQRNWIGRSEGAEIDFEISGIGDPVTVFTTRPDTLFGATYLVLAPEHKLVDGFKKNITNWGEVEKYREETKKKDEIERTAEGKEKTGVLLQGVRAINPATKKEIPVYIADYVLDHYGTGAIMAVPAHDKRDFDFALKYDLPVICVVEPYDFDQNLVPRIVSDISDEDSQKIYEEIIVGKRCFEGKGRSIHSNIYDGLSSDEARGKITDSFGRKKITYKLRDWVFSRQRYWGEPIPIIHCESCGVVPVPENDLPVVLPEVESYAPTGTGESPLADIDEWVTTTCPSCGGKGKRETNTMPQWAGSSWYYLRYMDPQNTSALVSREREAYWNTVDMYVGGAEHATRHLIYARFWHKFLYDIGVVSTLEPFTRLQHVGLIMGEDGRKMSKRYGNVVNPDEIVVTYGADSLRVYEMFMGPFDQNISWNTDSIMGSRRFIERVWKMGKKVSSEKDSQSSPEALSALHVAIKKVTEDISAFKFNTAISALMVCNNTFEKTNVSKKDFSLFLQLLAPFAPHITEELWSGMEGEGSIHVAPWPRAEEKYLVSDNVTIVIQVNGKMRGEMQVTRGETKENIIGLARKVEGVGKWIDGKVIVKEVFVPDKLVNFVVKEHST